MKAQISITKVVDAKTADYTSSPGTDSAGASKATVVFKRSAHTSGNTVFSVDGSFDGGTTWITGLPLISIAANTNAQTLIRVLSATLSSATSAAYAIDLSHFGWTHLRVVTDVTTDGTNDAWLNIEF